MTRLHQFVQCDRVLPDVVARVLHGCFPNDTINRLFELCFGGQGIGRRHSEFFLLVKSSLLQRPFLVALLLMSFIMELGEHIKSQGVHMRAKGLISTSPSAD